MKPVFLCNPKKCKKCPKTGCGYSKEPPVKLYYDNIPREIPRNCFCTTKFWQADWKRMFKFWWNKWFAKNKTYRCHHLCCLCEFKHEYYIDCMLDISGQDNTRVLGRGSGKTFWPPAYIIRQLDDFFASRKKTMYKEKTDNEGTTED